MDKKCTKCGKLQPIAKFYKNSRYRDGRHTWCKDCKLVSARANPEAGNKWRAENPEQVRAAKQKYAALNRAKVRESKRKWAAANPKVCLAKTRKYQASKLNATPQWLTQAQVKEMELFYINCPEGHHVDHIVPLQGSQVRGLHVPWNLQYLPAHLNQVKSNKVA